MKEDDIKKAIAYAGKSQRLVSKEINETPMNFNKKIKRETLKSDDMQKIAKAIGAEYKEYFKFPDGTKIGIK
ncbi:hypothetical protein [uncultured Dubosiella sp.]|uniref:hypothetical protein n=1 Tax=uncultured Dubosiella sp. TaxID=1937011 RepID=UPI002625094D|nr:hypothetical protein [uncultured Dubosiella sp.]